MKHNELRSIAHNIADSLGSGCGLLIGIYEMDIYGEVRKSAEGFITVDFLNGTTFGGKPSDLLARAVRLYQEALPGLCAKHGASISSFEELTVRYSSDRLSGRFVVNVKDQNGRRSVTEFRGIPGQRVKVLDQLGRLRPKHATN